MLAWSIRFGSACFGKAPLFTLAIGLAICAPVGTAWAQSANIVGNWSLVWQGARDNYTGTLNVTSKTNQRLFEGKLTLFTSKGERVTELANIKVSGNEVRIDCHSPSKKTWNPDAFFVIYSGERMEGYSLDSAGQRGRKIVFKRQ